MPRIGWKERHRRMREALQEAWGAAALEQGDPGLREAYDAIPRAPIRIIACPLSKDINQGGILRVADAFRVEHVDLSPEEEFAIDFAGNRGTLRRQPYRWIPAEDAVREAREEGRFLVALTLAPGARPLREVPWRFPCGIVLGSERDGIHPEIVQACDEVAAIPLYGLVTSLNVVSAAAIALYEAVEAYRQENPEFAPVRRGSRALLELEPAVYENPVIEKA
jgi:tRNA G18 (ribose-2'-O)-methylase SpoU